MTIITVGDHIVNLDNVVSLDIDGDKVARIWYINSPEPVNVQAPVFANSLFNVLKPSMVVIGDQIVNVENVVSFDVDGPGNVARIWFVGSTTPIPIQVQVHFQVLLNVLRQKGLV